MEEIRLQADGVTHHLRENTAYQQLSRVYDESYLSWMLYHFTVWRDLQDLKGHVKDRIRSIANEDKRRRAYVLLMSAHLWAAVKMEHAMEVKLQIMTSPSTGEKHL